MAKNPPETPPEDSEPRAIRFSNKAAKSMRVLKISQRHGHDKILKTIELLQEHDYPPNVDVTKMKWLLHGHAVHVANVKGKPEYRIIFQAYDDHVNIENVMTAELFHTRHSAKGMG